MWLRRVAPYQQGPAAYVTVTLTIWNKQKKKLQSDKMEQPILKHHMVLPPGNLR
jgi:hypothetical protein